MGSHTLFPSRPAASPVKPLPMSCRHCGQILVDGRAVAQLDAADRPALAQHEDGVMSVVPFPRLWIPVPVPIQIDEGGVVGQPVGKIGVRRSFTAGGRQDGGEFLLQPLLAGGEVFEGLLAVGVAGAGGGQDQPCQVLTGGPEFPELVSGLPIGGCGGVEQTAALLQDAGDGGLAGPQHGVISG